MHLLAVQKFAFKMHINAKVEIENEKSLSASSASVGADSYEDDQNQVHFPSPPAFAEVSQPTEFVPSIPGAMIISQIPTMNDDFKAPPIQDTSMKKRKRVSAFDYIE